MLTITLLNGAEKKFSQPVAAYDIAKDISPKLAQDSVAVVINNELKDLSTQIENDATCEFIKPESTLGLEVLRHSCAHLLAQAIKQLYPSAQITIGPVIEDGFYYDIDCEQTFSELELQTIEEKMREIAATKLTVSRHLMSREAAIDLFRGMGEHFKVEIIQSIPEAENLSFYQQGDFIDLCRGPHVPNTAFLKHFKLLKVSGAYWRGDHQQKMLQRIYGTCFAKKSDLDDYLYRIEEAAKRDHRLLGKKMELFHFQEEAPGMVFWHEQGWTIFKLLQQIIIKALGTDYLEVRTPQVVERSLWEKSGHWDMYAKNMFALEVDERQYAIKPMNCPCHVQIYNQRLRSYRELPLRLAEFGSCHRYEPSGALHGLMRVRNFTQDDAHIFCTEDQILDEVLKFNQLVTKVYSLFGFNNVSVKLSTRPEKRVGDDALWDKAEDALAKALQMGGFAYEIQEGEGAFYGPKIEFVLQDCLNRRWQCGTVQIDFSMPQRLEAYYIDEHSKKVHPVMIHRAIFGSLERFIGILIEHYAGALPFSLAPTQLVVLPISEKFHDYAQEVTKKLHENDFRVKIDLRNEKIGYKIREHVLKKVPYLVILGEQEQAHKTLSLRHRSGEQQQDLTFEQMHEYLHDQLFVKEGV